MAKTKYLGSTLRDAASRGLSLTPRSCPRHLPSARRLRQCWKSLWSPASPMQVLAGVEADDESSYASLKSWVACLRCDL